MSHAPIRIGLLGAARITWPAIITPIWNSPDLQRQFQVTAIAARDPARARDFAQEHNIPKVYESYATLISAPDVDIIYNALPINWHAHWTIKAIEAGKTVLCEKPFAMNLSEAEAMIAASRAHNQRIIEAFHYRYHPAFTTCLDWVETGDIGPIRRIEAEFSTAIKDKGYEIRHHVETGGGAMMDLGCYPLNWILSLMPGEPVSVTANASLTAKGVDETLEAELTFPEAITAHIRTSMAPNQNFTARLVITGEAGRIDFVNPLAPHKGASLTHYTHTNSYADTLVKSANIASPTTYAYQLSALADAIRSGETLPTEGATILRQQKWIDAIYKAAGLAHLRNRPMAQ